MPEMTDEPKRAVIGGGMMKVTKVDDVEARVNRALLLADDLARETDQSFYEKEICVLATALRSAREEIERQKTLVTLLQLETKRLNIALALGKATP